MIRRHSRTAGIAATAVLSSTLLAHAGPTVIRDEALQDLALTPTLGRGYSIATNTFQSICMVDIPQTTPSYDFKYKFVEVHTSVKEDGSGIEVSYPSMGYGEQSLGPASSQTAATPLETMSDAIAALTETGVSNVSTDVVSSSTTVTREAGEIVESGKVSVSKRHVMTDHIIVLFEIDLYYASIDEGKAKLSEPATNLLMTDDVPGFLEACGMYYARSINRRSTFASIYSFKQTNTDTDFEFKSELKKRITKTITETKQTYSKVKQPLMSWSYYGKPFGAQYCIQVGEGSDPVNNSAWRDNYLCSTEDIGLTYNWWGQRTRDSDCVYLREPEEQGHHHWNDNTICVRDDQDLDLEFSVNGPVSGKECVRMEEPGDCHHAQWGWNCENAAWKNNYLCYKAREDKIVAGAVTTGTRQEVDYQTEQLDGSAEGTFDRSRAWKKELENRELTITTMGFGLAKDPESMLIATNSDEFKGAVKSAFSALMKDTTVGRVTSMEVVPWLENPLFQSLVKLPPAPVPSMPWMATAAGAAAGIKLPGSPPTTTAATPADGTAPAAPAEGAAPAAPATPAPTAAPVAPGTVVTVAPGTVVATTGPKPGDIITPYARKRILNVNSEFVTELDRAARGKLNVYYKAKRCKVAIEMDYMSQNPKALTEFTFKDHPERPRPLAWMNDRGQKCTAGMTRDCRQQAVKYVDRDNKPCTPTSSNTSTCTAQLDPFGGTWGDAWFLSNRDRRKKMKLRDLYDRFGPLTLAIIFAEYEAFVYGGKDKEVTIDVKDTNKRTLLVNAAYATGNYPKNLFPGAMQCIDDLMMTKFSLLAHHSIPSCKRVEEQFVVVSGGVVDDFCMPRPDVAQRKIMGTELNAPDNYDGVMLNAPQQENATSKGAVFSGGNAVNENAVGAQSRQQSGSALDTSRIDNTPPPAQ